MPAGVTTLGAVRTAAKQRADMVNSAFLTDAEWNTLLQLALQELYGLLVQKFGDDYYVKDPPYSFTTDGTNDHYALPEDFFKLLGVDLQLYNVTPAQYVTVDPFNFRERNRYAAPNAQAFWGVTNLRYRLNGGKLWLAPFPAAGQSIRVHYAPRLTLPTLDADTIDGVNGWEDYLIIEAAMRAKDKEESDVSVLAAQKAAVMQRLEAEAENRDATGVATTTDIRSMWGEGVAAGGYPWGGGSW